MHFLAGEKTPAVQPRLFWQVHAGVLLYPSVSGKGFVMEALNTVVQFILSMGAAVFVPLIMFVLGKIVGMKTGEAFMAALTLGIAFTGINVITSFMTGAIQPAAEELADKTGLVLTTVDTGWPAMSAIAWSWPLGALCFPLLIVINVVMLLANKTSTLNIDLWNCWGLLFTCVLVRYACITAGMGEALAVVLAFIAAGVQVVIGLLIGDAWQPTIESMSGIQGVTIPHAMTYTAAIMLPFEKLLEKIPVIEKNHVDATWLREHLGVFGENSVMGIIIGLLLGVVAYWDSGNLFGYFDAGGSFVGGTLQNALTLGIQAACAMHLFPMVSKLFTEALNPISDAVGEWVKQRFEGRELYVGVDWPIVAGSNELWVLTIVMVPVELVWAIVLAPSGINSLLPFAGIINTCLAVPTLFICEGNLIKMLIMGVIISPIYLIVGSAVAPACTDLAATYSPDTLAGLADGALISWSSMECPDFRYLIAQAVSGHVVYIVLFVGWLALFVWLLKEMGRRNAAIRVELGK